MKRGLRFVLGLSMAAMLAIGSFATAVMAEEVPDASNDPAVTLVYAEVNPLDTTVVGQVAMHFAERVNELSGGTVTIDVQGGGVLGAEGDFCDNMIGGVGTIDMARLSVSTLTGYGVPKSALLSCPLHLPIVIISGISQPVISRRSSWMSRMRMALACMVCSLVRRASVISSQINRFPAWTSFRV
jgi:TRAP-type C4-dicarboxylate transport system substrate-binding protein